MERLTKRLPDGKVVTDCDSCEQKKDKQCTFSGCRDSLIKRLAAYEDTGWTPEMLHKLGENAGHMWDFAQAAENMTVGRLKELAEADKDGRVVVLPCKVGDTVWIVGAVRKLYSAKVRTFFCGHTSAVRGDDNDGHIHMIRTTECDLKMQEFGKTVFLSREEAEKALQEMESRS